MNFYQFFELLIMFDRSANDQKINFFYEKIYGDENEMKKLKKKT